MQLYTAMEHLWLAGYVPWIEQLPRNKKQNQNTPCYQNLTPLAPTALHM